MSNPTASKHELLLFCDGSVSPQTKVGYGAYLLLAASDGLADEFLQQVKIKCFIPTTSTKLELQTLLWALGTLESAAHPITIYTDSQNIVGLPQRRKQLEQNDFCSKAGRCLANADLYREFYRYVDMLECRFVKLSGHLPARQKTTLDRFFSLVDKASRQALRDHCV